MKDTLQPGMEFNLKFQVPKNKTVPYLYPESDRFQEMPEVFATGFMVGFLEWACMEALEPHLDPGERTVGTMINVTHESATPPGMEVSAHVRCIAVEGRNIRWEVEARDEKDVIGRGQHERFIIDLDKFSDQLAKKQS